MDGFALSDSYGIGIVFNIVPDAPASESYLLETRFVIWALIHLADHMYYYRIRRPTVAIVYWSGNPVKIITVQ